MSVFERSLTTKMSIAFVSESIKKFNIHKTVGAEMLSKGCFRLNL